MAGLWEPSAGVFWSTPPATPKEGWSLLTIIVCALIIAIIGVATARIVRESKESGWRLRQHMVELGGAATLIYLVILVALTWGRFGSLLTMPLNEVGDFLAGAFGPVAFLWLVLGFLQQGDELRQGTEALKLQAAELKNSVEQQSIMAAAAMQQIDAQREALQHQLDEKDRTLKARFLTSIKREQLPSGEIMCSVSLQNTGSSAFRVHAVFDPPIPNTGTSKDIGDVPKNKSAQFSLRFYPEHPQAQGTMTLIYDDSEGNRREDELSYSVKGKWLHLER